MYKRETWRKVQKEKKYAEWKGNYVRGKKIKYGARENSAETKRPRMKDAGVEENIKTISSEKFIAERARGGRKNPSNTETSINSICRFPRNKSKARWRLKLRESFSSLVIDYVPVSSQARGRAALGRRMAAKNGQKRQREKGESPARPGKPDSKAGGKTRKARKERADRSLGWPSCDFFVSRVEKQQVLKITTASSLKIDARVASVKGREKSLHFKISDLSKCQFFSFFSHYFHQNRHLLKHVCVRIFMQS